MRRAAFEGTPLRGSHDPLKSSGTSPNFLITLASLKSPVAGSPVRLNATAPTVTFLAWERLSAQYNGDGIEAFGRLAWRDAVIGGDERQRDKGPAHGREVRCPVMAATAI
jgi:hypothetical protein